MANIHYQTNPGAVIPKPGTPEGDRVRDLFISQLHSIVGGDDRMRLLWLPKSTETTTSTTEDKDARTVTYDATIAAQISQLGSGIQVDFDGTADEADTPDVNDLSFGDSVVDEPFSVVALAEPDANNALMTLAAKENSATAEEWALFLDASGHPNFKLTDESATATLERRDATAAGTAWTLLSGTYDGSGAVSGLRIYKDAARVDDTDDSSGTYVAMENTAALVHIGARYTTKEQFYNGSIALVMVVAVELSPDQQWAIKAAVKSFFDLAL